MRNKLTAKSYFLTVYFLMAAVQFWSAFHHQLFGDEAFYWLEGQWLALSYSEVPGWTPWTLAIMDWLLPKHHFFIRLPSLMAALCVPWLAIFISRSLTANHGNQWLAGLLLLSLPLLGVAGILAIPDIWLVFFTLFSIWLLILAITTGHQYFYLLLGLALALGINVHLRFWFIIFITCLAVFWQFRKQSPILLKLLALTMPTMALGFIPVLVFNVQNDFPLLAFQLSERHPWAFQASHINFFLVQVIITTPWIFYLCIKNIFINASINSESDCSRLLKIITVTAAVHWLVYAIVGFFSDTLRLNVHWTLASYALLLLPTTLNTAVSARLKRWAVLTGLTCHFGLLLTLGYWLHTETPQTTINSRITENAKGWQQLAKHTDQLLLKMGRQQLLADHFMTLAQLKFYSKQAQSIKSLSHPMNQKHGRNKQLELMGLIRETSDQSQILLVEHSALKLNELIEFYQSNCHALNGLELLDSLDISQGLKSYHYFVTGAGPEQCDMPPIVYYEFNNQVLNGWILQDKSKPLEVHIQDITSNKFTQNIQLRAQGLGSNSIFKSLDPNQYELLMFELDEPAINNRQSIQLKMISDTHSILSQRLTLSP